jgi:hypothetical protein
VTPAAIIGFLEIVMDHNCPVCKSNLRWELPPAKMKLKRWQATYMKQCSKCGSELEYNSHLNEARINKIFLPMGIIFILDKIFEISVKNGTFNTIWTWLFFCTLIALSIFSIFLYLVIPSNWPRWRLIDNSSINVQKA